MLMYYVKVTLNDLLYVYCYVFKYVKIYLMQSKLKEYLKLRKAPVSDDGRSH